MSSNNGKSAQNLSPVALSAAAESRVQELMKKYPSTRSVVMPALYIAQTELGYCNDDAIRWVSAKLNLPTADVYEVATFYTMYYKKPVGRYHVQICRTLSCMLCGAKQLTEAVKKRLNLKPGEISADGMWSYEEVECLGSCGTAPMVEINDVYFENLDPEKLNALMDRIEKEKPDIRYSEVTGKLGEGMSDRTRSEVW